MNIQEELQSAFEELQGEHLSSNMGQRKVPLLLPDLYVWKSSVISFFLTYRPLANELKRRKVFPQRMNSHKEDEQRDNYSISVL